CVPAATPCASDGAPACRTTTIHVPGVRRSKRYRPDASVIAVRAAPVASFRTWTIASATAWPACVRTVPLSVAEVVWASAPPPGSAASIAPQSARACSRAVGRLAEPPRRPGGFDRPHHGERDREHRGAGNDPTVSIALDWRGRIP